MKYVVGRPKRMGDEWYEEEDTSFLARIVLADNDDPIDTGILTAHGVPIYRTREQRPIGFVQIREK